MRHDPIPNIGELRAILTEIASLRARVTALEASSRPIVHLTRTETNLPTAVLDERAGRAIVEALVAIAAADADMSRTDVLYRTDRPAAHVRQWIYFEDQAKGVSQPIIGRFFGRDHTTVLHGVRAERARREARPEVAGVFVTRRAG